MKIVVATKNRYLECGLMSVLEDYDVIIAREFFTLAKRFRSLDGEESWFILCDERTGGLMRCLFHGRHFIQVSVESMKTLSQIQEKIRSGLWTYNRLSGTLSLSQMVVLFGYIFQEYSQGRLARMLGINSGTVHAFLTTAMSRNGLQGVNAKYLAGLR